MNLHNKKLEQQGRKRRAKILRERLSGKTVRELSDKHKISGSRIRWMIAKAKEEND